MKRLFIIFLFFVCTTVNAQTYKAEYRGTVRMIPKSLPSFSSDSSNSKINKAFVLNLILQDVNLQTLTTVVFNDSLRKIKFRTKSDQPLSFRVTNNNEGYVVYDNSKNEYFVINSKTNKVGKIENITPWGLEKVLIERDTLLSGKKYLFIKIDGKDQLLLFFMDPELPKNLTPIAGSFDPSLNVKGGVYKMIKIYNNKTYQMTAVLTGYKKIEPEKFENYFRE